MNLGLEKYRYFIEQLRDAELFRDLPLEALNEFLEIAECTSWAKKTCVLDTHYSYYKCYFIISGKVKTYCYDLQKDRQLTLYLLKKNDLFDVFSLYGHTPCNLYYESLTATEMFAVSLESMQKWMKNYPKFEKMLLRYVLSKMKKIQEAHIDLALNDTSTRLARLLVKNMNRESFEIELINELSHLELAAMIGTTRAVLNRHLQEFKQQGIIETGKRQIRVLNPSWLESKISAADK